MDLPGILDRTARRLARLVHPESGLPLGPEHPISAPKYVRHVGPVTDLLPLAADLISQTSRLGLHALSRTFRSSGVGIADWNGEVVLAHEIVDAQPVLRGSPRRRPDGIDEVSIRLVDLPSHLAVSAFPHTADQHAATLAFRRMAGLCAAIVSGAASAIVLDEADRQLLWNHGSSMAHACASGDAPNALWSVRWPTPWSQMALEGSSPEEIRAWSPAPMLSLSAQQSGGHAELTISASRSVGPYNCADPMETLRCLNRLAEPMPLA